jgi:hypothetical protein
MRYENMREGPMHIFGKLARRLLFVSTEPQLRLAIEHSSVDKLKKREDEAGFKEMPRSGKAPLPLRQTSANSTTSSSATRSARMYASDTGKWHGSVI